jgi:hypothetical protein
MGFSLLYDHGNGVLLVRFERVLTRAVHEAVFAAARRFVEKFGDRPAIADFSAVEEVDVDMEFWRELGRRPRVIRGAARVLVAPEDQVFGMIRMYGLLQAGSGDEPMVVRTLTQACAYLGIDRPDFRPIEV